MALVCALTSPQIDSSPNSLLIYRRAIDQKQSALLIGEVMALSLPFRGNLHFPVIITILVLESFHFSVYCAFPIESKGLASLR